MKFGNFFFKSVVFSYQMNVPVNFLLASSIAAFLDFVFSGPFSCSKTFHCGVGVTSVGRKVPASLEVELPHVRSYSLGCFEFEFFFWT